MTFMTSEAALDSTGLDAVEGIGATSGIAGVETMATVGGGGDRTDVGGVDTTVVGRGGGDCPCSSSLPQSESDLKQ